MGWCRSVPPSSHQSFQALQVSKSTLNVRVRFVGVPLPGTGAWTGAMAWDPGATASCRDVQGDERV